MSMNSSQCFSDDEITEALRYGAEKLGLTNGFRCQQVHALRAFFRGHDLFVSLPTGFGKSVIFQAAPVCSDYLRKNANSGPGVPDPLKAVALVVIPLKSLIADQIRKLQGFGLIGVDISGGLTDVIREGISSARYSHIFASPESLLEEDGREMFSLLKHRHWICGFFIDESHCVSKWGSSSGDTKAFRSAYSKLGEIRSKLRSGVAAVALTATATKDVRHTIIDSIGLHNFVLVNESPDKMNIKHVVLKSPSKDYDIIFRHVINGVRDNGVSCERTIVYCQSRKTCSDVYATFIALLPRDCHRYVEMYHTNTEHDIQERIIESMAIPQGEVRVLIATIAYGMGVDSSQVHRAVLCGRSSALDDYIQMSGRVGRDGKPSIAITLCYPGDTAGRASSSSMKDFIEGTRCRRKVIREVFGAASDATMLERVVPHDCCDVCTVECDCGCGGNAIGPFEKNVRKSLEKGVCEEFPLNIPSPNQVTSLERALDDYRDNLLSAEPNFIYCGADIACGLSTPTIEQIVKECNVEMNFASFTRRYTLPRKIAPDVWAIVCSTLGRSPHVDGSDQEFTLYESGEDDDCSEVSEDEYQRPVIVSDSDE